MSELTFDSRPDIRKSALEVLFDTLRSHGDKFSPGLWEKVFDSVLFPIFDYVRGAMEPATLGDDDSEKEQAEVEMDAWLYETCTLALQLVVDLFVKFYPVVNPLLGKILSLLTGFIKRPHKSLAAIGVAAFARLMNNAGDLFSDVKWEEFLRGLQDAVVESLPDLTKLVTTARDEQANNLSQHSVSPHNGLENQDGKEPPVLQQLLGDIKCRTAVQLLLVQV